MRYLLNWQYAFLWIPLFLIGGFLLNLGGYPLLDVDEGAFSEATREMLSSGNWSATYLDGLPRYDKPILTYWIQGSLVSLFGLNEFTLRLHSLFSGLLWGAAIYSFSREFINRKSAFAALIIFSSTLMITVIGRAAIADALLNLFIALIFFDIYRYQQHQERKYVLRTWLWISLGLLTKGPVAAGIPLIVSGLWFLSLQQFRPWLNAIFNPLGGLIVALILSPWIWFLWQEQGAGFFYGFLIEHNLNRFADTKEGHGGYWYYYLFALPFVLLPYSGLLSIFRRLDSLWRRPFERLMIIWFVVVFILVSISSTQLPHYVLYGVTPLLLLFAKYRTVWLKAYYIWLFPLTFAILQVSLPLVAEDLAKGSSSLYLKEMLNRAPEILNHGYLFFALALLVLNVIMILLPLSLWKRLAMVGLAQALFVNFYFLPAIAYLQQEPIKQAALQARNITTPVVAYKIHMPSFSLYRQAITERREPFPGDHVFTKADSVTAITERFPQHHIDILFAEGGIRLLKIAAQDTGSADAQVQ